MAIPTNTTLSIVSSRNYSAIVESSAFSHRNNALYTVNGKADSSVLVLDCAKALIQLQAQVNFAVSKGLFGYAERTNESHERLNAIMVEFGIKDAVIQCIKDHVA